MLKFLRAIFTLATPEADKPRGKVLILRALPFGADSRATRWAAIYAPRTIEWGCWGSTAEEHKSHNILDRRPRSGLVAFAMGYAAFVLMSFFFALKRLRPGDTLLCIDLETALLGALAAKLRGATWHYDMADPFYLAKPVPFKRAWRIIEAMYIRRASIASAPLASRFNLFFQEIPANCRVVENVPNLTPSTYKRDFLPIIGSERQMTLGYFGTIEQHRGIEDLLQFVKTHPNTRFVIAGRGPLTELIKSETQACNRIKFLGAYLPHQLQELTRHVDIYCSLYYQSKALHVFAAPNKYFEHLALGIPILLSADTPYAEDVLHNKTGWVMPDGLTALENWYQQTRNDVSAFERCAERASALWSRRYADWMDQQRRFFAEYR